MIACRPVEMWRWLRKSKDRGRKTWRECVKDDTDVLGLSTEWAVFIEMWRGLISGQKSNPSRAWKNWTFQK